ncbi:hypothetical protein BDQ12DRAFT_700109 [Crucibulum laeve]|uniref:BTB domain-containing protein n=1 Tax=Crucibulum laeve TaxID=68775 RepID=A0A5C3LR14_9AGAR|nr:hypothetical protein BDQ12DRAFT_700109 [Crucibulum laeve]
MALSDHYLPETDLCNQFTQQEDYRMFQTSVSPGPYLDSNFTQVPTPIEETTVVSVSTVFFPGANGVEADLVLSSSDSVLFYVQSSIIIAACDTAFRSIANMPLSNKKLRNVILNIPDSSEVLNIILHMLYGTSCAQHSPAFDALITAVDRMPFYEISPKALIVPNTPLYTYLLSHAPLYPIQLYTLAGHHKLEALAIHTSSHLLAYPLANITDDTAQRIGAIYLKRLMNLHVNRLNALKEILLLPPHPHPPTKECGFGEQKKLTRAWALVSAYLAWESRPDLSTHSMQIAFGPVAERLTCQQCKGGVNSRIKDVIVQWISVKVSNTVYPLCAARYS